jgi:antitoxin (DNA-binding transcriptional repressor) of toxin-antitoxin stability system
VAVYRARGAESLGGMRSYLRSALCYAGAVKTISQRELRNASAALMNAVERGESFLITRHGIEIAELRPTPVKSFVSASEIKAALASLPAGGHAKMRAEADTLFGEDRLGD